MIELLDLIAIVVSGLMVGSELAVAAFVHPTLNKLTDNSHLPAATALARVQGRFMPFWYILVTLVTCAVAFVQWQQSGHLPIWTIGSIVAWVSAIAYSVTMLVPINNRIASWENGTPPENWKTFRNRWDQLHRWRVVLLTIAFTFLVEGVVNR